VPAPRTYSPQQTGNTLVDRNLDAVAAAMADLESRVAGLVSPLVLLTARDAQVTDQILVDYQGAGGHTIRLPFAASAGKGRGAFVHVLNNGKGPITIAAVGTDTVNGANTIELATASAFLGMGNGDKAWSSLSTQAPAEPAVEPTYFSAVDYVALFGAGNGVGAQVGTGDFSVGDKFTTTRNLSCTGVRFYWKQVSGGDSRTVRGTIWAASTPVATKDIVVSTTGIYTATFDTPLVVNQYEAHATTVWDTTSGGSNKRYTYVNSTGSGPFAQLAIIDFYQGGPFHIVQASHRSAAGNAVPSGSEPSIMFPVEAVFDPVPLD
jgi:hypothetical protein